MLDASFRDIYASPAELCAAIRNRLEQAEYACLLEAVDIIPDHHWIFIHSRKFKKGGSAHRGRNGKFKYDAINQADLLSSVCKLVPLVAANLLPVVKFTNIANVSSGEKLIVAYCVQGVAEPQRVRKLLQCELGDRVYWGSDFPEPNGTIVE